MSRYDGADSCVYPGTEAEMYAVMIASFNGDEKPLAALLDRITAIIE